MLFSLLLISLFLFCFPVSAQKTVGVFLTAPNTIAKNAEQINKLETRLAELLPNTKYNNFSIQQMMAKDYDYRKRKNIFQSPNQFTFDIFLKELMIVSGKDIS